MNPFIIDSKKDGRYFLPFQIQGCGDDGKLFDSIRSKKIFELLLPQGHSLDASWSCILNFENQIFLSFSAASTGVGGWREAGSLNIFFSTSFDWGCAPWVTAAHFPICDFKVASIFKVAVDEAEFYSECGLEFISEQGSILRVATGIPPSSMSIELPKDKNLFAPEFSIDQCRLIEV